MSLMPGNEAISASRSSARGISSSGNLDVYAVLSLCRFKSNTSIFLKSLLACCADLPAVLALVLGCIHSLVSSP